MSGDHDMVADVAAEVELDVAFSGAPRGEAADRVRLAARSDCLPQALRDLARDPDLIVRATVALNERCNREIDTILSGDTDERVRALLAGRVARLFSDMNVPDQTEAADHVLSTLRALALDQAIRVRAALADALASTDRAPRDLVLQLASDAVGEVSDRIIRLSPMLSDSDLLAILSTPQSPSAAECVASRERLSAIVADAIVDQADAPTIRALLSNQSACIRESTLDVLVGRAPEHIDWHAPLVRRPLLSAHAVRALSEFITCDLLRVLAMRTDLEPAKLEIVRQRLMAQAGDNDDGLVAHVRALQAEGTLDETALRDAARAGDTRLLLVQLAVSSGIGLSIVERVLELRSAKALVSLVWRGGFSMTLAVDIQNLLSRFGPDTVVAPAIDDGFPLTEDEMCWQIELMNGTDAKQA